VVTQGEITGVPKYAHGHTEKPDPWFAWYWSSSDPMTGQVHHPFWVRDIDIRAWEKLSSIIRPFIE